MAFYLVKAKPKDNLGELRHKIDSGIICNLKPFGNSLQYSLENAKLDDENNALWIEEDYCSPPLAMERESVLDQYFDKIEVDIVLSEEEGLSKIISKQSLWPDKKII